MVPIGYIVVDMEPEATHSGPSPVELAIIERVRRELRAADISQRQAAEQLGISHTTLHRRLTGRRPLTVSDLLQLTELLGVPFSRFVPENLAA